MSKIFGNKLKELRNEKNISQQTLADYFCVSKMTISAWENNKQEPCIEDIKKLAAYFKITTDYLLGYETEDGTCADTFEELSIFQTNNIKYKRSKK